MVAIVAGRPDGLHQLGDRTQVHLGGRDVTAVAPDAGGWWAIIGQQEVWRSSADGSWQQVATVEGLQARCLAATRAGVLVGTSGGHLLRVDEGWAEPVESFEHVPGRQGWYTPWGGPPDVRSLAEDPDGRLYVNVHVGGVVRSSDAGLRWEPTIDVNADVHQVLADTQGRLVAATARGLAASFDLGDSWVFETAGLHGTYLRSVALAGDTVLVGASTGPATRHAAVYRSDGIGGTLERCRRGLPEWFGANIDTHCLAAAGSAAAFGTADGQLFVSTDEGRSWSLAADGPGPVRCVGMSDGL